MRIIVLISVLMATINNLYACSCGGPSTFCETLNDSNDSIYWDAVDQQGERVFVSGVVTDKVLHGMDVKILRSYYDQIETDTVRIWGDIGWWCRPYVSIFDVGDTIIMNMAVIDSSSWFTFNFGGAELGEKVGDYELTFCGVKYLRVKNNKVIGPISPGVDEMSLSIFESRIQQDYFEDCLILNIDDIHPPLTLFPNPVETQVTIESSQQVCNLQLLDSSGKVVYNEVNLYKKNFKLDLSSFPNGIYILKIHSHKRQPIVRRISKN